MPTRKSYSPVRTFARVTLFERDPRIEHSKQQVRTFRLGTYMKVSCTQSQSFDGVFNCPVEATLAVIGGKWKGLILFHLAQSGTHRFSELRRKIPGVSERMLTQQLRELECDGVVHREVYPEVPPKVEYSLTHYGETLRPICELMCVWGKKHIKRIKIKEGSIKHGKQ
jgi:DNA-binding HxlR family transcriptional regulator